MGSTLGGFLAGFGLCLFIVSFGVFYGLYTAYTGSLQWVDDINRIYDLSHSDSYQRAVMIMRNISSIAGPLADIARIFGLNQSFTQYLSEIPRGAGYMEEIQRASERAKSAVSSLPLAMLADAAIVIVSIVMIISGYRLIKKQP